MLSIQIINKLFNYEHVMRFKSIELFIYKDIWSTYKCIILNKFQRIYINIQRRYHIQYNIILERNRINSHAHNESPTREPSDQV